MLRQNEILNPKDNKNYILKEYSHCLLRNNHPDGRICCISGLPPTGVNPPNPSVPVIDM